MRKLMAIGMMLCIFTVFIGIGAAAPFKLIYGTNSQTITASATGNWDKTATQQQTVYAEGGPGTQLNAGQSQSVTAQNDLTGRYARGSQNQNIYVAGMGSSSAYGTASQSGSYSA
jgi:uncharacterized protein (UPF0333 family)